jgi:hypothetical protein
MTTDDALRAALERYRQVCAERGLIEYITARGGRVTARELQRGNGRRYPTAELAPGPTKRRGAGARPASDRPGCSAPSGTGPTRRSALLRAAGLSLVPFVQVACGAVWRQ